MAYLLRLADVQYAGDKGRHVPGGRNAMERIQHDGHSAPLSRQCADAHHARLRSVAKGVDDRLRTEGSYGGYQIGRRKT